MAGSGRGDVLFSESVLWAVLAEGGGGSLAPRVNLDSRLSSVFGPVSATLVCQKKYVFFFQLFFLP